MATAPEQVPAAKVVRVLFAGGDSVSRTHIEQLLTRTGYEVVVAQDGTETRRALESPGSPKLAVLDWDVPGGAVELCRQLRHGRLHRDIYIILLTHWNEPNERVEGLEAGADDCVYKPVDVRELRIKLQLGMQALLERALYESEERFRGAFECAGIGMALVRVGGEFLQINQSLCDFLGYTPDELLKKNFHSFADPTDLPSSRELLEQFLEGVHRSSEFERRFLTKAGNVAWASVTVSTVLDADSRNTCFVVQVQDIAERKAAEEALRRSEAFARAITDNAQDLIFVLNLQVQWIYASPSHSTMLGFEPGELLGHNASEILHPADRAKVEEVIPEILGGKDPGAIVIRFHHKDGTWRHLEARGALLRNANGAPEGIIGIARGIDERLQAERKLQAAHAETELFLRSIPSILIGLDSKGRITRWNPTAAATLGVPPEAALGRPVDNCGIKWLRPDMQAELASWLQTESSRRCDDLTFDLNGQVRFLGLHIRRIPSEHVEGTVLLVTGADITRRKTLEDQLRQAQKLEAIGQLAAGVAHEINTPTQYVGDNVRFLKDSWMAIAELLQFCQTLRKESLRGPISKQLSLTLNEICDRSDLDYLLKEVPPAIEQSLEGVQRVAKIVRAMKEFSHPGAEDKRGIDLNKAIETTVAVAKNEWKYVADVCLHLDMDLPLVPCHAGELNQVLLNLIVNASHAISAASDNSTPKGRITITTQRRPPWAEIAIADTGVGIPESIRSRVFEPFFTTKPVGQGTGQGLALAHSVVVNRHQGQIWFDSTPGKGTTFFIRLPLESGELHHDQAHPVR